MNAFQEFIWRGLIYHATPEAEKLLSGERVTMYIGFDPTAKSLHVGSLLPIMGLARMQRAGHRPVALVGGGTGLIGDPSGKSAERQLLDEATVEANLAGIRKQLERFLEFGSAENSALVVNNLDWLGSIGLIEFLRDTGKHFTVNYMMAKESVKRRLGSEDGLSFTEFSYMLLQAYDFLVLHDRYGCLMQMGGSDQWGNILAGIELIRKLRARQAHGLVMPLVTTAGGTKFGKTEAGTVWLDPELTSPYRFYQFWFNTDDRDVDQYLKFFTWLDETEIDELDRATQEEPSKRHAQRALAEHATRLVHGDDGLKRAEMATRVLFGASLEELSARDILDVFEDVPSAEVARTRLEDGGVTLVDLAAETGLAASKGEARRLVRAGGLNVNNVRETDESRRIQLDDAIESRVIVLRRGQKNYRVVHIV